VNVVYEEAGGKDQRLGIIVPSAFGGAAQRNRLKRLVREVFRLHKFSLPPGWDIIVMPRKGVTAVPTTLKAVEAELLMLWDKKTPGQTGHPR